MNSAKSEKDSARKTAGKTPARKTSAGKTSASKTSRRAPVPAPKAVASPASSALRVSRRDRRRAQSREELLDAADAILLRDGVASVTVDAVAHEVDLSKTALYHYFASKDALIFELMFRHLEAEAAAVSTAVAAVRGAREALAALIRSVIAYHAPHLATFRLCYLQGQVVGPAFMSMSAEMIARVRPLNDTLYGGVEAQLLADQKRGRLREGVNPRRTAFLAHMAALGLLTMKGMVEGANDPLIHKDHELVDELAGIFGNAVWKV